MPRLLAGTAKVNLTPPIGCPLAGYAGRAHGATGVHDELWCRVLYLATTGDTAGSAPGELALVSCDLLGLHLDSVRAIQERVQAEAGIAPEALLLACTHTHSGPVYHSRDSQLAARHLAAMEDRIAGAITWAKRQARPARLGLGRRPVQCGVNRRERRPDGRIVLGINPDGPVYPWVDILKVEDEAGRLLATWFCHPCHPVVLGYNNYEVSGDFAGHAEAFIEATTGALALFANGFAGNINSLPHNGTFADVERLGVRLGAAVLQGLTEIETTAEVPILTGRLFTVPLPLDPVPPLEQARAEAAAARAHWEEVARRQAQGGSRWELGRARTALEQAEARLRLAERQERPAGLPLTVQLARVGDAALVAVPAEVFIELGLTIQQRSPFRPTLPVGYANGAWGYLPTREAFAEGGYEVDTRCRYHGLAITADAGQTLVEAVVQELAKW